MTNKLPGITAADVIKVLEKKNFFFPVKVAAILTICLKGPALSF
jgi:hypothetical protein